MEDDMVFVSRQQIEYMIEAVINEQNILYARSFLSFRKDKIIRKTEYNLFYSLHTDRNTHVDLLKENFKKKIAEIFIDMYQSKKIDFNYGTQRYYVCYKEESMYPTLRSDYEHNR